MQTKLHFKKTFNIFSYAFGVFCFGFVVSSGDYVLSGAEIFGFDFSEITLMLVLFVFINLAVSSFISIFLLKITSAKIVNGLLLYLVIYFTVAQIYFHFFSELYINSQKVLVAGIFTSSILFVLGFFYLFDIFSFISRFISNLSSLYLVILLIFCGIKTTTKKQGEQGGNIIPYSDYLDNIYKEFISSSQKKFSVFYIIFDELPFSILSDGNAIKSSFPNIKALSEKSLFFTRAFSNYDGTRRSVPSMFTGKYLKEEKYYQENSRIDDWVLEHRNMFVDLKKCNYKINTYGDLFKVLTKMSSDNIMREEFYNEEVLISGTIRFLATLNSFGIVKHRDYLHYGANTEAIKITNSSNQPSFYFMHYAGTHGAYTYLPDGTRDFKKPNCYPVHDTDALLGKRTIPLEQAPLVSGKQLKTLHYFDKVLGEKIEEILNNFKKENILIIFTSDHGVGWRPPHLSRVLGHVNWDIVGVPLMIYCPSKLKPEVYDKPFPLIDLLPTIYDILGIKYKEEEFDGKSFFNKQREKRGDLFAYSAGCQYILQNYSWKEMNTAFPYIPYSKTEPLQNVGSECIKYEY
jgi:hypothetical protein